MRECDKNIGFAFKVLNYRFPDQRIRSRIDQFFDSDELDYVRKMEVPSPVDRAHPANSDDFLDGITINQNITPLQLLNRLSTIVEILYALILVQCFPPIFPID
jgi:hypothetical protein